MINKIRGFKFDELRQRFRLTPTETRVAVFVVAAFVLGLITKCYRDAHSSPAPIENHFGKTESVSKSKNAYHETNDPATGPSKSTEKLDFSDSETKQEHR